MSAHLELNQINPPPPDDEPPWFTACAVVVASLLLAFGLSVCAAAVFRLFAS